MGKNKFTSIEVIIRSMKNCLQFMYASELLIIKLKCQNSLVTTFQNMVPDHWLIKDNGNFKILGVEIFDKGFVHWALLQDTAIEILEPENLRQMMKDKIRKMSSIYDINFNIENY